MLAHQKVRAFRPVVSTIGLSKDFLTGLCCSGVDKNRAINLQEYPIFSEPETESREKRLANIIARCGGVTSILARAEQYAGEGL